MPPDDIAMSSSSEPCIPYGKIKGLIVNNPDLACLGAWLDRFNPIKVMRMEDMEIRHSAILAWLLDPHGSHGLSDAFLKAFLSEAMRTNEPRAIDIALADLRSTEIRREEKSLDILVLVPAQRWAFLIENKINSKQGRDQLSRYGETIKYVLGASFEEISIGKIFLKPKDDGYVSMRYTNVCQILGQIIDSESTRIGPEVRTFIEHYLEVIMEKTDSSPRHAEMRAPAQKIYREHRDAIDFIVNYGSTSDLAIAINETFGGKETFECAGSFYRRFNANSSQMSFVPEEWAAKLTKHVREWDGCGKWWKSGLPLICWFELKEIGREGRAEVRLYAEVGPIANPDTRRDLIETIKELADDGHSIGFSSQAIADSTKYSRFLKNNTESVRDKNDQEEISKAILNLLAKFKPTFGAIGKALPEFVERHPEGR